MNDGLRFVIKRPDCVSVPPKEGKRIIRDAKENETHLSGPSAASVRPLKAVQARHAGSGQIRP